MLAMVANPNNMEWTPTFPSLRFSAAVGIPRDDSFCQHSSMGVAHACASVTVVYNHQRTLSSGQYGTRTALDFITQV